MPAAPAGTVVYTFTDDLGTEILVVTLQYNPNDLSFDTEPPLHAENDSGHDLTLYMAGRPVAIPVGVSDISASELIADGILSAAGPVSITMIAD